MEHIKRNTVGIGQTLIATVGTVTLLAEVTHGEPEVIFDQVIPTVDVVFTSKCRDCGQGERRESTNLWRDSWYQVSNSQAFSKTGWGKWAREHAVECPEKLRTVARYLTVGGAVVEVTNRHESRCAGCGLNEASDSESSVREWAQGHAERCRAMPVED